ncbi:MAG TPA: SDR family oxidoreductase [Xanthobacteraceae bacterium]|jgi:NAD(P)-dependent dehydrogenase (short-subunit alcohol dehydrogenase family)
MKQLQDRVAIVTGSNSGLGRAIAESFAAEGAKVVLAARRKEALDEVAAGIKAKGGVALAVPTDVTKEAEVIALFKKALDAFSRVDILVNNAGIARGAPIEDLMLKTWQELIDVNLTAAFLCSREAVRTMKSRGGGRIINMASISSRAPRQHSAAYTTSKYALEGLTRSLTFDGRAYGVVASVIHPGAVATGFTPGAKPGHGKTPQDYLMDPADIARIAVLMCTLPPEVNLFDATILPNLQPSFLGRG